VVVLRDLWQNRNCIIWIDNFNKLLKFQMALMNVRSQMTPMNWTVIGLHLLDTKDLGDQDATAEPVSLQTHPDDGREPPQKFMRSDYLLPAKRGLIKQKLLEAMSQPAAGISARVNRIPLSLETKEQAKTSTDISSARFFNPYKLLDRNISENAVNIALHNDLRLKFHLQNRFTFSLLDVALYAKCLKVRKIFLFQITKQ